MEMRTSKPQAGNKFYTTQANGGYSTCIQGKPTDVCDVLANCVGYACGRFNEIIGSMKYPSLNCNAENFIKRVEKFYPSLQITDYPTLGGIMVFAKGEVGNDKDGAGHVFIVERIDGANQIYTSESGYKSKAFWNSTRRNTNGRWGLGTGYTFIGNIVNPAIGDVHYVEPPKPVEPTPTPQPTVDILTLVKKTIRGDFGNGEKRKQALGEHYSEVQHQVNENIKHGTTRWDNVKLY